MEVVKYDMEERLMEEALSLEPGSKERNSAIEDYCKVRRSNLESEKFEAECAEKTDKAIIEDERYQSEQQAKAEKEKFDKKMQIANLAVPSLLYVGCTQLILKFEENGTLISSVGRNFVSKLPGLLPKFKIR